MAKVVQKVQLNIKRIIRLRVRCAESHKNPWLTRLYVIWADPQPPPVKGSPTPPLNFHLGITDASGYLSPIFSGFDPHPIKSLAVVPDYKYYFYFVRHPGVDLPSDILKDLNNDVDAAKKKWGDWQSVSPEFVNVGKDKSGKAIKEAIIQIPEDPSWFTPQGSDLYEGWVLFRDMPGGSTDFHTLRVDQCTALLKQVTRLQYHLGALRYPVGNQWHPYSPETFPDPNVRKKRPPPGQSQFLYPNEGVFDTVTWNCVLRLQRGVKAGEAVLLDPQTRRTPLWTDGTYDPTAEAKDTQLQVRESALYVSNQSAGKDAKADVPYETVVDQNTGDAIQTWLDKGFRKPGKILVARNELDSWMMEDVFPVINSFSEQLKHLGYSEGAQFNSTFRDARMSVGSVGKGQVRRSIHKSGYAFDMAMKAYVGPLHDYPLYFSRDHSVTSKVQWIVYALVEDGNIAPGPNPELYCKSINQWIYNANSLDGGSEAVITADDAAKQLSLRAALSGKASYSFLNFTKVAEQFGLARISAHTTIADVNQGWTQTPAEVFRLDSAESLTTAVNRLRLHVDDDPASMISINGTQYSAGELSDLVKFLGLWLRAAGGHAATPDVLVAAWTKVGYRFLTRIMAKTFWGRKVLEIEQGQSQGQEIELSHTYNFKGGLYPFTLRPITTPVTLKPGDTISFPVLPGHPANMEWWHFQYPGQSSPIKTGFQGLSWGRILGDVGWTAEGLLGDDQGMLIYGHSGLGYTTEDLDKTAL